MTSQQTTKMLQADIKDNLHHQLNIVGQLPNPACASVTEINDCAIQQCIDKIKEHRSCDLRKKNIYTHYRTTKVKNWTHN